MVLLNLLEKLTLLLNANFSTPTLEFCYWSGLIHDNSSPLPASEQTLMLFTAHLSRTIKASSIKVYLSGVQSLHRPVFIWSVFYTVKWLQGTGTKQHLPITIAILHQLYKIINLNHCSGALFWAACLTGFFGQGQANPQFHLQ